MRDRYPTGSVARHRRSKRTNAVLEALRRSDRFRTPRQLFDELRLTATVSVGRTTLYRILYKLEAQGILESTRTEGGELLYRARNGSGTGHNILCRRCGRTEQFTFDGLRLRIERAAQRHRYTEVTYRWDMHGVCGDCTRPAG
ncbi:Fur family transcriptional regulator [Nocardia sp. NPDC003693]